MAITLMRKDKSEERSMTNPTKASIESLRQIEPFQAGFFFFFLFVEATGMEHSRKAKILHHLTNFA